ncbi:PAS domain S-box protein [Herbaspirillum sp. C7C8]|uniref:sensor domain-containing diguanylate cyclase n=1 Tax=Herbaspirillum sp. C7C8 TaxID=2736665 RepID=UPI001F517752|nr:PAS domain S-box protein [Herbaspirillum sp. C7C8]MCI1007368.1 PAS domain S-box protein [Herbaspirillum sp. C7C8]
MQLLDSPPSPELDRIIRIALRVFEAPIALVSLIDCDRQWFKSRIGLDVAETPRDISFCTHAVEADEMLIVQNADSDERFFQNPLVTGAPYIKFYAGQPLRSIDGIPLGTLCVMDRNPRDFKDDDKKALEDLAILAEHFLHNIESQIRLQRVRKAHQRTEEMYSLIVEKASVGLAVISSDGIWLEMNSRLSEMLASPPESLIGEYVAPFIDSRDEFAKELFFDRLFGEIPSSPIETRMIRLDGISVWVQISLTRFDSSGEGDGSVVMAVTDIDDRKRNEIELETLQRDLERRVAERTIQLEDAISSLEFEASQRRNAELLTISEKERFRATLENATDAFIEVNSFGLIRMWNRSAERIFGWKEEEVLGRELASFIIPPSLRHVHFEAFSASFSTKQWRFQGKRIEVQAQRRSGQIFPVEMTLGVTQLDGEYLVNVFLQDITKRKEDEKRIRTAARRIKTITDNLPALIAYLDEKEIYQFHNRQHEVLFGKSADYFISRHLKEVFGPGFYRMAESSVRNVLAGAYQSIEIELDLSRGPRWFVVDLVPDYSFEDELVDKNTVIGFYMLATDSTDRKQREQRLSHIASHDFLTGLPNRRSFNEKLKQVLAITDQNSLEFAIVFIDLDDFKKVNDNYGHEFGDELLREFARCAKEAFRSSDFIARLAGDEFVAVIENIAKNRQEVDRIVARLRSKLKCEVRLPSGLSEISASIGIAISTGNVSSSDILQAADAAMYRAKQLGKNQTVYAD